MSNFGWWRANCCRLCWRYCDWILACTIQRLCEQFHGQSCCSMECKVWYYYDTQLYFSFEVKISFASTFTMYFVPLIMFWVELSCTSHLPGMMIYQAWGKKVMDDPRSSITIGSPTTWVTCNACHRLETLDFPTIQPFFLISRVRVKEATSLMKTHHLKMSRVK